MSQNLITLNLSADDYAELDAALAKAESILSGLIDLSVNTRRSLVKMGDRSESFCRQALVLLAQNPQMVPPSLNVADAQNDLHQLDQLRVRAHRTRKLLGRMDDTMTALGSDVMRASLDGYTLLKITGKGSGLESLRQGIAVRFARSPRAANESPTLKPVPSKADAI